jgi:hypothetical protein
MRVVADDLWLCIDCTMVAANGDDSGIEDPDRAEEVHKAVAEMGPHLVLDSGEGGEGSQEFSWAACDCCGDHDGGTRERFAILGE